MGERRIALPVGGLPNARQITAATRNTAATPSMIGSETSSIGSGSDARKRRKTIPAVRWSPPELEMLTPKGEHFIPCSTRVMFDGRISLDGIATAKTL
jgi:hypothetical protein